MILDEYIRTKEMRGIEANAVYLGISRSIMMENAGRGLAEEVIKRFPPDKTITIFCGKGGNGGDGFVAARHLSSKGYSIKVVLLGKGQDIRSSEAYTNWKILESMKKSIELEERERLDDLEIDSDVIIDALIGTGIKGALRSPYKELVSKINSSKAYKISVDIPSGLLADSGKVKGTSINADLTVTFHKPKTGFKDKPPQIGELIIKRIGIPHEAELWCGPGDVYITHPKRDRDSHKGMFGRLVVIGGSKTYSGAPALTSLGAYAVGVDLVYSAVPEAVAYIISGYSPSIISLNLEGPYFSRKHIDELSPFIEKADAVAIGPGLGLNEDTVEAVSNIVRYVEKLNKSLLLDADGLKAFSRNKKKLDNPTLFTPHGGEFEILTGKSVTGDIYKKGEIVKSEAEKLGGTILLKGPVDIISDGTKIRYNFTGNPGMTVGGTGDVLSGIASGYLAMGSTPMDAAASSAFINGFAGDLIYKEKGYHILPEDLIARIPYVIEDAINERLKCV